MNLLWTLSNWKRTGPVEPSLDLAAAVRAKGHSVRVIYGRAPRGRNNGAAEAAAARGLEVVDIGLALDKHRFFLRDRRDARRLRRHLAEVSYDAVITTLQNDHRIAARARQGKRAPTLVRLAFQPIAEVVETAPREPTDLVFAFLPETPPAEAPFEIRRLDPALSIDTLRAEAGDWSGARETLEVAPDAFLFGIVARMQTHRRFELLWEAVAKLKQEGLAFRLAAIGRGTNQATVAHQPVQELGLQDVVRFPGYLRGIDYASTLAALDAQIFLVPGSDPTCRALREGMALGVPSLVTARAPLPSIVEDGVTGRVVAEETPAAWADAMAAFVQDRDRLRTMGAAAEDRARERYDAPRVAARFLEALDEVRAATWPS
ncbi:MAG: glycosyltransferase [Planctomycetota bacterium]|nr:glycosyltransferase [Planctomycetota bacterium]